MKVFKFGGASVDAVSRISNLPDILKKYGSEKILVVISAMGKTTNALEKVAEAFYTRDTDKTRDLFQKIKEFHTDIANDLGISNDKTFQLRMRDFFTEIEWLLNDKPSRSFDYYYDQIVCIGELLSTSIISEYLNRVGIHNVWVDVRDIFVTDDQFRAAAIDWDKTLGRIEEHIRSLFC